MQAVLPSLPARVSLFPSAMTTIQSFSIAMVLATVARLAAAPRMMTSAERTMKSGRGTSPHIPRSSPNMTARPTAHRVTSPFCTSRDPNTTGSEE